eukprot:Pompholyxophrys_sp_v1_NODE_2_length_20472_cov_5.132586.p6 type:complete len:357 gc:universal NODE_2_length_20472_cov_5.132586:16919-17989(+)
MNKEEIWKFVENSNEKYQVSNTGRVKSFKQNKNGLIMKGNLHNSGYHRFLLNINEKSTHIDTHRLVAKHFVPNPYNLPIVDHIDGNKLNNNADNLRWVDYTQSSLNTKIQKNNTSGCKGVYYHTSKNRWMATCVINGKLTMKSFIELNDAIECRKEWVRLYYPSEFYSTNDTTTIKGDIEKKVIHPLQLENEEWKYLNDSNNIYQVSNFGRIRSFKKYKDGKIIIGNINASGYIRHNIVINDKQIQPSIHQIVAKHFIPNPNNLPIVDHIDGNKLNNCVSNLRWVSNQENTLNSKMRLLNTSGYKGVSEYCGGWVANWVENNKSRSKKFQNKNDAIEYRNKMVDTHYSKEHYITDR